MKLKPQQPHLSHPKSMGTETRLDHQEEIKSKEHTERLNKDKKKEVLITVYVESSINACRKGGVDRDFDDRTSNKKSRPLFISKISRGYDRRAQLLSYARELRRKPEWPENNSKADNIVSCLEMKAETNKKMSVKKLRNPVRIEIAKNRKKYQRLVPEVDISCKPKSEIFLRNTKNYKNKKKGNRRLDFRFVGKLRGIMSGFCKEK